MGNKTGINFKETGSYIFAKLNNIREKIGDLEYELRHIDKERELLEALVKELNLCEACFAKGKLYHHTSPDEGHLEMCPKCKGEGRIIPEIK